MSIKKLKSGIILVDILLALALAALFVTIIASSSLDARDIFELAKARNALLDAYEAHAAEFGVHLPQEYQSADGISSLSRWYGNDMVEDTITVSSTDPRIPSIRFDKVYAYPFATTSDAIGRPLCAPDYQDHAFVGSYAFQAPHVVMNKTAMILPITLPIDPLLPLTDIEVRDGIAYVSADSSTASDPDLLIADIHDPTRPIIRSSINTGPGIASIALAGNRIYAAADSTAAQLHIIRLDSLDSLALEEKYKLPLPFATATPPVATSIFYYRGYVYLGTEKWSGDELSVIDVSNPVLPAKVGGLETGSQVNDIYIRNGIAYVSASDQDQLRIVNVSDPSQPALLDAFSPSGWQRQEGKAAYSFEDGLDFARTSGGYDIPQDHEAFVWATSSLAGQATPDSLNVPGGVYGIVADRSHIYLATRQINSEFMILDSDMSASSSVSYSLPVAPQAMTCDGSHIYILAHTAPVIYDISFQ